MKKPFILLLFLLSWLNGNASTSLFNYVIDSLDNEIAICENISRKSDILFEKYLAINMLFFDRCDQGYLDNQLDQMNQYATSARNKRIRLKYFVLKVLSANRVLDDSVKNEMYLDSISKLLEIERLKDLNGWLYYARADTDFLVRDDFSNATKNLIRTKKLALQDNDEVLLNEANFLLFAIHTIVENEKQSARIGEDIITHLQKAQDRLSLSKLGWIYLELGKLYEDVGKPDLATDSYMKSKKLFDKTNYTSGIQELIVVELNSLSQQKKYKEVISLGQRHEDETENVSETMALMIKLEILLAAVADEQLNLATKYLKKVEEYEYYILGTDEIKYMYQAAKAKVQAHNKDFGKAYQNLLESSLLKDSLYNIQSNKAIANLQSTYDLERKEEALQASRKENRRNLLFLIISVIGLLGLVGLLVLARRYQNRLKVQNQTIKEQYQKLEHYSQANKRMLNILSHDIKEPLLGVGILLRQMPNMDEKLGHIVGQINQQIGAVNNVLSGVLSLTKKDTQGYANLSECSTGLLDELSARAEKKLIDWHVAIPEDIEIAIPYATTKIILRSILTNAIKYSHPSGKIEVVADGVQVHIRDYGIGMNANVKNKLFENVMDSTIGTNDEVGTGIGLYLAQELAQEHNYQIEIVNVEEGSCFVLKPITT